MLQHLWVKVLHVCFWAGGHVVCVAQHMGPVNRHGLCHYLADTTAVGIATLAVTYSNMPVIFNCNCYVYNSVMCLDDIPGAPHCQWPQVGATPKFVDLG